MHSRDSKIYALIALVAICASSHLVSAQSVLSNGTTDYPDHTASEPPRHGHHEGVHLFKVEWPEVETLFLISLWVFFAGIAKIVFHMIPKLGHVLPESCLLIVIGIVFGTILYAAGSTQSLPTMVFFFFLLPPIILDAGRWDSLEHFFHWPHTLGSTARRLSRFSVDLNSVQIFLFSSLISAVDPVAVLAIFEEVHVNDVLYIVVFGESILNDAVSIVMYRVFMQFTVLGPENIDGAEVLKGVVSFPIVALGGTVIGIVWGLLIGFATRFTHNALIIEPIFIFVMSYLAFLMAELFHFSGVLALIFCGITMKNYIQTNIAPTSNTTVKYMLKMLSSSSETVIFIFLGLSTVNSDNVWNWWFVIVTIVGCTLYRFVGVFTLTALVNRFRLQKLDFVDQVVSGYGGLRGAVSFALVLLIDESTIADAEIRRMFVTTTIAVVYFTVFVQGCTIKSLVQWLSVKKASPHRELGVGERIHEQLMEHVLACVEAVSTGGSRVRERVRAFDAAYIRPLLVRDYKSIQQLKLIQTYEALIVGDAKREFWMQSRLRKDGDEGGADDKSLVTAMDLITEEEEEFQKPQLRSKSRPTTTVELGEPVVIDDSMFISAKGPKMSSYNRHTLMLNDLKEDMSQMAVPLPQPSIAGGEGGGRQSRLLRNTGMGMRNSNPYRQSGIPLPLPRVSRAEITKRLSSFGVVPEMQEQFQQYYEQQQDQQDEDLGAIRRRTTYGYRNTTTVITTPTPAVIVEARNYHAAHSNV